MIDYYAELDLARRACNKRQAEFALSLASGLDRLGAFCVVYGQKYKEKKRFYYANKKINELLQGPAGRYYGLLMHPLNEQTIAPYALQREDRLRLLSMGAVLAYQRAQEDPDAKQLNPMVRCINELNKMTGEHAAETVEIKSTIMAACINTTISETEATELYKNVLQGTRIEGIEGQSLASDEQRLDYQPIRQKIDELDPEIKEGGDTQRPAHT